MASPALTRDTTLRSPLRRVFGRRVFVVTYLAEAQSILGDQLARVALSVIVFRATGSAAATAGTYAATFLPALAGGFGLTSIGDRLDRRAVMVGCDVIRAVCFAVMTWRVHDLPLVIALVVLTVAIGPLFSAAHLSLLASRLDVEEFTAGNGARLITSQTMQVLGFALGGVLAAVFAPRDALLLNAVTFAVSAILLRVGLAPIPQRSVPESDEERSLVTAAARDTDTVVNELPRLVRRSETSRAVRALLLAALGVSFFVVPEGLAVPAANALHKGDAAAGVLLAAGALGGAIGAAFLLRVPPDHRPRVAWLMGCLSGVPLVFSAVLANWSVAWLLIALCWLLSGSAAAYVVHMMSVVVHSIPDENRARQVGRISAMLLSSQGLGVVAFGMLAQWIGPVASVGVAGACGSMFILAVCRWGSHPAAHRRR